MRPEVQLSRCKIVLSETASRIWIFLNFFELPRDSFRFFQFFFFHKDYLLLQCLKIKDVNVTK